MSWFRKTAGFMNDVQFTRNAAGVFFEKDYNRVSVFTLTLYYCYGETRDVVSLLLWRMYEAKNE